MELDIKFAAKEINELLWRGDKTVCTAESCTAGRISSAITAIPGSSNYFQGGLVCYQNQIKEKFLGVKHETIENYDVVSEEVVKEMVLGANELFNTDYAVAITGYAGPAGAMETAGTVMVGVIWIAAGNKDGVTTLKLHEDNGRDKNLASATNAALHLLLTRIKDDIPATREEEIVTTEG